MKIKNGNYIHIINRQCKADDIQVNSILKELEPPTNNQLQRYVDALLTKKDKSDNFMYDFFSVFSQSSIIFPLFSLFPILFPLFSIFHVFFQLLSLFHTLIPILFPFFFFYFQFSSPQFLCLPFSFSVFSYFLFIFFFLVYLLCFMSSCVWYLILSLIYSHLYNVIHWASPCRQLFHLRW